MKMLLTTAAIACAALLAACQHDMASGQAAATGSSANASATTGAGSNGLSEPNANTSGTPSAPSTTPRTGGPP